MLERLAGNDALKSELGAALRGGVARAAGNGPRNSKRGDKGEHAAAAHGGEH